MYLPAGNLHTYLRGTGVEISANSDNVLRGGLTSKHIDVPELLRVLDFSYGALPVQCGEPSGRTDRVSHSGRGVPVDRLEWAAASRLRSLHSQWPQILLCTGGSGGCIPATVAGVTVRRGGSYGWPRRNPRSRLSRPWSGAAIPRRYPAWPMIPVHPRAVIRRGKSDLSVVANRHVAWRVGRVTGGGGCRRGAGQAAIVAALAANVGIAVAKFVGFLVTGSSSMLAEAVHSVADSGNQVLLLLGGKRAPARGRRGAPVRLRPRAVLLRLRRRDRAVQPRLACSRSTRACTSPRTRETLERRWWRSGSCSSRSCWRGSRFRTAVSESNRIRARQPGWQFIRHAKAPELPVVLLEDSGALVGLVLALGRRRADASLTDDAGGTPSARCASALLLGRHRGRPRRSR